MYIRMGERGVYVEGGGGYQLPQGLMPRKPKTMFNVAKYKIVL